MPESSPGFLAPATYRWRLLRRSGRLAGTALLTAILVACGGSDGDGGSSNAGGGGGQTPVDLLASFKQQTLSWQTCDPAAMDDDPKVVALGERVQCALMRVPLDYANPSSAELQIEIVKVNAEQPLQKLGAIVFNPGGPGEDGLSLAPSVSVKLMSARSDEAGPLLKEMSRRYDLVTFAPRGTGSHSPLRCGKLEEHAPMTLISLDASLENITNIEQNARLFAEDCAANPMSKHIHTEATARDMDLLRGLLGEEKLNYIGYSYGSWLGASYAGLFPERVGRMLFDSVVDVTSSFVDATLLDALASQRIIDEVMLPHAASNPDRYGLGKDATALRNRLLALSTQIKRLLLQTWEPGNPQALNSSIFTAAAALGLQDVLTQRPQASQEELEAEIGASPAFAISQVAQQARLLAEALFDADDEVDLAAIEPVFWSVICNDTGRLATHQNQQYWTAQERDLAARYPLVAVSAAFNPCIYWNASDNKMPLVAQASKAGPLLMLQSRYDVQTHVEGAQKTLEVLGNAHMIVIENEYQHSIFPYGTACVDRQVANYFLHGELPERLSSCAGKPLAG